MVAGDEGHRQFTVFVGVTAVILLLPQLLQLRMHLIVIHIGILFLHDAIQSGVINIVGAVGRLEALHLPVGHAHREVGIRIERFVLVLFHQRLHVGAIVLVKFSCLHTVSDHRCFILVEKGQV